MFNHSTNTAWFFSVLMAALIFSLSLAGVAAAQGNTSLGRRASSNQFNLRVTGEFSDAFSSFAGMISYALVSRTLGPGDFIACAAVVKRQMDNRHLISLLNRMKHGKIKIHVPRQPQLFFP